MQEIALQPFAYQKMTVSLSNQACQIQLRQEAFGLFMDLYVNDSPIILGVICQNLNRIVRDIYLGFSGDFVFFDMQGNSDPDYTGLGSRFRLVYLTEDDLGGLG